MPVEFVQSPFANVTYLPIKNVTDKLGIWTGLAGQIAGTPATFADGMSTPAASSGSGSSSKPSLALIIGAVRRSRATKAAASSPSTISDSAPVSSLQTPVAYDAPIATEPKPLYGQPVPPQAAQSFGQPQTAPALNASGEPQSVHSQQQPLYGQPQPLYTPGGAGTAPARQPSVDGQP
ncbi:hypothetical protein HK101_008692 [Irineochytrium annulatum]|nr:hypothetical protein HK101_008692 [Irineochytrium annulatum]